jgi:hypothetical protein
MCNSETVSALSLSLSRFSLNHPYRAYGRYLSVFLTNIRVHFCSTIVVNETRRKREREKEHRRFWNTHTLKKETEDDAMRAFAHAYNSLFLATLLSWYTAIIRRAFFFTFVL